MIMPRDWFEQCKVERIILHWTGGTINISALDKQHYHFVIDGLANVHKCVKYSLNSAPVKLGYAAHTLNCNSNAIGISLCGMSGAVERPFSSGRYPINMAQMNRAVALIAQLVDFHKLIVTPKTVLSHAEVQNNLGIKQRGKWDIAIFPWDIRYDTARECGDYIRMKVMQQKGSA